MFIGSTNILICTTPALKPDLVINLDENKFEYKSTELVKISKTHTVSDKKFVTNLVKEVGAMDHGVLKKDQFSWDSIPMGDG